MQNVAAAAAFVQVIDVLCDQGEDRQAVFEFGQRAMTGIGLGLLDGVQPMHIPLPDEAWVGSKSLLCGEPLGIKARPQAIFDIAEGGDARLGADA